MDSRANPSKPHESELSAMFRPPVNRAMRVLDRSFFRKIVPLSAATVLKASDISRVRNELQRSRDLLSAPRLNPIRVAQGDNPDQKKCILLREGVKHDGEDTCGSVGMRITVD
jgi:tRNA (guanine37-N1)-methyltransferase